MKIATSFRFIGCEFALKNFFLAFSFFDLFFFFNLFIYIFSFFLQISTFQHFRQWARNKPIQVQLSIQGIILSSPPVCDPRVKGDEWGHCCDFHPGKQAQAWLSHLQFRKVGLEGVPLAAPFSWIADHQYLMLMGYLFYWDYSSPVLFTGEIT